MASWLSTNRSGFSDAPPRRADWLIACGLVVVALFFRLLYAANVHQIVLYGDSIHYDGAGMGLLTRHQLSFWGGAPDAYVTPGYPLFLAACYGFVSLFRSVHDTMLFFTVWVQCVLSALTTGFIYFAARRALRPVWAAVGCLIWVFYPPSLWADTQILTEVLYTFLLFVYVWAFLWACERRTVWAWAAAGLALGLTGLVRPTVFPLVLAAVAYLAVWAWRESGFRPAIGQAAAHVVGFILPLVPWWVRNWRLFHRVILTDTEIGNPLLYGTDPNFRNDPDLGRGLTSEQQKQLALQRIKEQFTHHPLQALHWYTVGKLNELFRQPWYQPTPVHPAVLAVALHLHLLWVVFGAAGLLLGLRKPAIRWFAFLALFFIVVQLPFIPINRYVYPILPLFFIGTANLAQTVADWVGMRRKGVRWT